MLQKIKSFITKCIRVWHVLKKPDKKEYTTVAKVSAIGILALGFIGFVIALIMNFL